MVRLFLEDVKLRKKPWGRAVIVYPFTPPVREYYQLERLWHEAPLVVRMQ